MYDFKIIKWIKNNTTTVDFIYINTDKSKIYKKFRKTDKFTLKTIKNVYSKIKKFEFVPRMEFFENENILVEEYFKKKLTIFNKPYDYIQQLLCIHKTLRVNNIYHNDYKSYHFYVKDGKIKIIDWEQCTFGSPRSALIDNFGSPRYSLLVSNNISLFILYYSLDIITLFILVSYIILVYRK